MAAEPSDADAIVGELLRDCSRTDRPGADGPAALAQLEKVMLNVLAHPGEARFRRLRCGNARVAALLAVPHAERLLAAFGFVAEMADAAPPEAGGAEAPAAAAAAAAGGVAAPPAQERFLVLPAWAPGEPGVQAAIQRGVEHVEAAGQRRQTQLGALGQERRAREEAEARARAKEADSRVTDERRALVAQARAKREAEEKVRADTLRQIQEDADERKRKASIQAQRPSNSPGLPRGGGGGGGGANAAMHTFKDIGVDLNNPPKPKKS
jgi:hypothetical protein